METLLKWEFCWNGNTAGMGTLVVKWEHCWNRNSAGMGALLSPLPLPTVLSCPWQSPPSCSDVYEGALLNGRKIQLSWIKWQTFLWSEVWQGMQNRAVLAPSKAAPLLWGFLCLHSIYLCTSCECVVLVQGIGWKGSQCPLRGNPKLSADSRITTWESRCRAVGVWMCSCQHGSVWKSNWMVLLCLTEAGEWGVHGWACEQKHHIPPNPLSPTVHPVARLLCIQKRLFTLLWCPHNWSASARWPEPCLRVKQRQ